MSEVQGTDAVEAPTQATSPSGATETVATNRQGAGSVPRLLQYYRDELRGKLIEQFGYKNIFEVPQIEKIVLNMGVGEAARDQRKIEGALRDLTLIAGQRAVPCTARRSVATFKLREGQKIGCKVTLRGRRAYEFLDRLVQVALPRVRDFRGLSARSFDGRGNYAFGLSEQITFPEIDYDTIEDIRGLDIVICTTAKTNEEAKALFAGLSVSVSRLAQKKPRADTQKKPRADAQKKPRADTQKKPRADAQKKPRADAQKKPRADAQKKPKEDTRKHRKTQWREKHS